MYYEPLSHFCLFSEELRIAYILLLYSFYPHINSVKPAGCEIIRNLQCALLRIQTEHEYEHRSPRLCLTF